MVKDPFNLHHFVLLLMDHIYVLTSLCYQFLFYLPPFIYLKPPLHPRRRPFLWPTLLLSLLILRVRKPQLNDFLPWMSGPLYGTLWLKTQQQSFLMSPAKLQYLTLPTLQLNPLESLKPSSPTELKPFSSSFHLSTMNPKTCSSYWKISSSNSLMMLLPTNQPRIIQTKPFWLKLTPLSICSPYTFRTTRPTPPQPWISIYTSKLRLPLKPIVSRRPIIIWLVLYPLLPQVVLVPQHTPLVSV